MDDMLIFGLNRAAMKALLEKIESYTLVGNNLRIWK